MQKAEARVATVKAHVIGGSGRSSILEQVVGKAEQTSVSDPAQDGYASAFKVDVLPPPYEPDVLCKVFENSNSLRQNVDAYKTNIDGFGHVFEPVIELRESGARDMIRDAIYLERAQNIAAGQPSSIEQLLPPTDQEIDEKIQTLQYAMRIEKATAESFFENCCAESSFVTLRRNTREDTEVTGNGYWEVIRNDAGAVSQFALMPSRSVRVVKTKSKSVSVKQTVRVGTLLTREETYKRRFRRYAQIAGDDIVYFKEYDDPTIVSSVSGKEYATVEALQLAEPNVPPANEVLHFKIPSIRNGAYGVPRWMGNLLSVLGSRSAEEVNFAYFENKAIPPIAILVSGGRLGEESVKRIQDFVEVEIKGKKNFHKILVIEAETSAGSIGLQDNAAAMRVEIKQLTDAQLKDGLFREYDSGNMDKVGFSFRMPRILRGDIRDFNRASAVAALDFAESQVFVPERNDFDFMMNRFLLPKLGIRLWRFKSLGPRLSDSQDWGDMISKLTIAGILTPQDAREIVSKKVLSHELPLIDADWVTQPLALTIAGVQADSELDGAIPLAGTTAPGVPASADPANLNGGQPSLTAPNPQVKPNLTLVAAAKRRLLNKAKELMHIRDAFNEQEAKEAVAKYQKERIDDGELVFNMTAEEMESRFGIRRQ